MNSTSRLPRLALVCGVSRLDILQHRLAMSPCLQRGGMPWSASFNAASAAAAFNAMLDSRPEADWLIWAHQDVYLPEGWAPRFAQALQEAMSRWPRLAVAGVYGLHGRGASARRAGHVLDRGRLLRESEPLPCRADSLDELLLAVRIDSGLRMDPALGFDFYATDLVLQARRQGLAAAVLDAYCEHWSDTPTAAPLPFGLVKRIGASAAVFEHKWARELPVTTPCFEIDRKGAVDRFFESLK